MSYISASPERRDVGPLRKMYMRCVARDPSMGQNSRDTQAVPLLWTSSASGSSRPATGVNSRTSNGNAAQLDRETLRLEARPSASINSRTGRIESSCTSEKCMQGARRGSCDETGLSYLICRGPETETELMEKQSNTDPSHTPNLHVFPAKILCQCPAAEA